MENDELRADVANAVDLSRAAMEFDWSRGVDDVRRFREIVGWTPAEFDTETMAVMLAKARLKKPFATFVIADLPIN